MTWWTHFNGVLFAAISTIRLVATSSFSHTAFLDAAFQFPNEVDCQSNIYGYAPASANNLAIISLAIVLDWHRNHSFFVGAVDAAPHIRYNIMIFRI
mmetsp:Transcript_1245/g.2825  ORF Transcript_1245/g.2825 Transcript_1245/m.2825 type:complete len:97 (+) Transcript_1245:519-809(+)